MGRIRSIKPEILEDEKTANLSHLEWRLFVSIWVIADDHGNLRGEASYVQGAALWALQIPGWEVEQALEGLARVGLIVFYRVRGQLYMHIAGWDKHQRVDKPGKPRMPIPSEEGAQQLRWDTIYSRNPRNSSREPSRDFYEDPRESLATDLRPPTSDPERELARAHAIPPSTEPALCTDAQQNTNEKEPTQTALARPPEQIPRARDTSLESSDLQERRRLRTEIWSAHLALFAMLQAEKIGIGSRPPRGFADPGEVELGMRIAELWVEHSSDPVARAREACLHVLEIAGAEAREKAQLKFLDGGLWHAKRFANASARSLRDFPAKTRRRFPWRDAIPSGAPLAVVSDEPDFGRSGS